MPPETIAERLAAREVGSALDWHLQRAEEIWSNALAHDLFDFIIDGDRTVREVCKTCWRTPGGRSDREQIRRANDQDWRTATG